MNPLPTPRKLILVPVALPRQTEWNARVIAWAAQR